MSFVFALIATGMLLAALALLALPLWRGGAGGGGRARQLEVLRQALDAGVVSAEEYAAKRAQLEQLPGGAPVRSRRAFAALLGVLLVLPLGALGLYLTLGEPRALDPAQLAAAPGAAPNGEHGPDMEKAIAGLAAKLQANPEDVEGWMLLGRAYKSQERFAEARDALKHAYDHAKDNPDVLAEYAEALALASANRRLQGEPREILERALKLDPQHQRTLWLLGIADYQAERWKDAIAHWEALEASLPPDAADVRASVAKQIDDARAKAGLPPRPSTALAGGGAEAAGATGTTPAVAAAAEAGDAAGGPHLTVAVTLDPSLAAQVAPDDVLFVFAKAASGPPMPLAVKRLRAADLPATVELTDGMGMMPSLKLSQFPQVIVGARLSKSGNAIARSGDLQALSAPLAVTTTSPVALRIDHRVP